MLSTSSRSFKNKFRAAFWPVHNYELGKFIPMSTLMFCILFNQNVLRILKDSILISEISAEIAGFAKVYCVTPAAALFVIIYAKMINYLTFEKIFYYLSAFFISFFVLFTFVIYPNIHIFHIHPDNLANWMERYPHFKWYISLVGNWGYIVYYSLAELWPNIFYVLLFWQFANELTTTEEAKRFYTLFSLFGNSSLILVGFLMMNLSSEDTIIKKFMSISDSKITLVQVSTTIVAIVAIICCLLVRFISKNVFTNPLFYAKAKSGSSTSERMGLIKSFKYIAKSKYLWLLLICSAAFGFAINLVEAVWKAKIKELYPTVNTYAEFNSLYILWTGVAIMVMTIIGNNIMRMHNWFVAAVISPVIIMVTGILFFVLIVFDQQILSLFDGAILMSPLALAVSIGGIQNILAKGTKYSIWDTSREMLYIPLDEELKTKGKAAVDVISAKVGKSSSGLVQSIIFTLVPTATFTLISPILMLVFTFVCLAWIYAVRKIYCEYQKIA
ncbi:ADP,ATP carrier protein [Rickettsia conorii subsp. heilongjiangensis]|uniref:ADP,ATP carrier protein n=1 Tax=Rickettsia conorii subsp. heilongjiangensis TaxID=226665 RepID=A0AAD1LT19_RICCR|nr:GTP/GDP exchange transporter Tlc5 [Rickettsia conorii]AEK75112.1 ADP,ATP carrier protein [Rickettsia conorii subsp. heilongjiangensis 054]BBM91844.1 ADP,ATP carrier protein [Rickettsia conorii subsp. heilongjiangensis]BBM93053.1 ADP,ATP carrier protein [Rickettsia conorii subsp. heilongjiangensis]BBM94262.1 ADP,ATP carrier protein [Rickettsia conorii subsp. heilongjiangensis]BBM95471.1 ADP,ATP carrier protein [Rickettsia conorii subsp. heilongjiangensis]